MPIPFCVNRTVDSEFKRCETEASAETVLMVFVATMRFEMGVSDEVGEDISSTSNWPFELMMPLVVIEI